MPHNEKGARAERELLKLLYGRGWAVMRSAGSGHNALSPDLVAVKGRVCVAFECKNRECPSLFIDSAQFATLQAWEARSGFDAYVAWRMNLVGWRFLRLFQFKATPKGYSFPRSRVLAESWTLDSF
jgi:Holliday junction resolvase